MAGLPEPIATLLQPPIQPVGGAEQGVSLGSLLRVVGGSVAAKHGWGGVAEEELDIDLTGLLLDAAEGLAAAGEEVRAWAGASKPAEVMLDGLAGSLSDSDHRCLFPLPWRTWMRWLSKSMSSRRSPTSSRRGGRCPGE